MKTVWKRRGVAAAVLLLVGLVMDCCWCAVRCT